MSETVLRSRAFGAQFAVPIVALGCVAVFGATRAGASLYIVGVLAAGVLIVVTVLIAAGWHSYVAIGSDTIEVRIGPKISRVRTMDADQIVVTGPARTPVLQLRVGRSPAQVTLPITEQQARELGEQLGIEVLRH